MFAVLDGRDADGAAANVRIHVCDASETVGEHIPRLYVIYSIPGSHRDPAWPSLLLVRNAIVLDPEPSDTSGSVSHWLAELKAGNERVTEAIWDRYFSTLVRVARKNLNPHVTRAADEEDVALSAFDSFIRGVDRGKFAKLNDRNDLWRLLLVITLRKAADQAKREMRQRRGGGRVKSATDLNAQQPGFENFCLDKALAREPTPAVAAMLRDQIVVLMKRLDDPVLQSIALAKMEGCTDQEIADRLDCARRTVVRKLAVIRQRWFEDSDS